jgi:hypothetical protein
MDQRIYINTVLPVTGNRGVGTVAITTPGDDLNWFSFLSDIVDPTTGKLVFKTYFVGGACTVCQAAGKPEDCTHKEMPPWKDEAVMNRMKAIMNVESFNREIGGVITVDAKLFYAHYVEAFRKLPLHEWVLPPDIIFVAVDPAGGGSQSHYTITSMAVDQGRWIVSFALVMHANNIHGHETRAFLLYEPFSRSVLHWSQAISVRYFCPSCNNQSAVPI